jgi:hypothetical protein
MVVVIAYATLAFARQASRTPGVTRRRMQAAAAGSLFLTLALVVAGLGVALTDLAGLWEELSAAIGLASGVCYFIAFAPPTWLRHAWQEPELRAFLAGAASLPRLPDLPTMVHELERGAASALGAPAANIAYGIRTGGGSTGTTGRTTRTYPPSGVTPNGTAAARRFGSWIQRSSPSPALLLSISARR